MDEMTIQELITAIRQAPPEATAKALSEILFMITVAAVNPPWPATAPDIAERVIGKLESLAQESKELKCKL